MKKLGEIGEIGFKQEFQKRFNDEIDKAINEARQLSSSELPEYLSNKTYQLTTKAKEIVIEIANENNVDLSSEDDITFIELKVPYYSRLNKILIVPFADGLKRLKESVD